MEAQQIKIRERVVEFIAHVKNERTGAELSPSTLRGNFYVLMRAFEKACGYKVNFLSEAVFGGKCTGMLAALHNKGRHLHAYVEVQNHHNVLSQEDIVTLYQSDCLSRSHPRRFITRITFL